MFKLPNLKVADGVLALFVVAIAALLLLPLPTFLLDLLIVLNLGCAFILLLLALYVPSALSLLSFPTILLLTTLFRLGLDVASTRLILTQGDAGRVIEAFGHVLVRGDVVVGLVVFFIVTVVHYIVVSKGSARVSEVAARFALDALPGKQMAIDADLRAGLINAEEAQKKRDDLRKESQLYGAMDGAMKFVQGDAVAGIIIIAINIVGGILRGVLSRGLSFEDAVSTYTVLTIGDGLVHQVPAILISICAGLVVTRISSTEHSTLGFDVGLQLGSRPGVVTFAGIILIGLGIFTPLPLLPFGLIGAAILGLGIWGTKKQKLVASGAASQSRSPVNLIQEIDEEEKFFREQPITVKVGPALMKRFGAESGGFRASLEKIRAEFFETTGAMLLPLVVVEDENVHHDEAHISIGRSQMFTFSLPSERLGVVAGAHHTAAQVFGLIPKAEFFHPFSGASIIVVEDTSTSRRIVESAGLKTWTEFEMLALKICFWLINHPEELISATAVHQRLRAMEKKYPGYVSDGLGDRVLSTSALTSVFQELIRERCSIGDMRAVMELVSKYCTDHGITPREQGEIIVSDIIDFIRTERPRIWWQQPSSHKGLVPVLTISESTNEAFEATQDRIGKNKILEQIYKRSLELGRVSGQLVPVFGKSLLIRELMRSFEITGIQEGTLPSELRLEVLGSL